jgi:O-antigen/teichoic acid export membrane protein
VSTASHAAGRRAIANTAFRAAGELGGKLGTFVLFAVLARTLGSSAVGTFVVAFAYVQVVTVLIDLGFDRVVIRRVAIDHEEMPSLLTDVLSLKLALALPVTALSWGLANVVGYDHDTLLCIYVLSGGLLLDSLNRTATSVLNARERGGLISTAIIVQRVSGAVLGIVALGAGFGVVAVCGAYGVGSALGLAVAMALVAVNVGAPARSFVPRRWPRLLRQSLPFALYDSLGFLLTKVDALVLSLLAAQAAIGLYGAASRLYEASWFVTFSLNAAFQAMFTYLSPSTEPSIGAVFERSIKLALTLLGPITVLYVVEAGPLCTLLFGDSFRASDEALRALAPSVVLMGVVSLSTTLVALRVGPRQLIPLSAGIVALNVVLTAALVPGLDAPGAGLAMSISVGVFAVASLWVAARAVGGVNLWRMTAAPVAAAVVMAAVMEPIGLLGLAVPAGAIAFALTFVAVERLVAPDDLRFLVQMLRNRQAAASTAGSTGSPAASR